MVHHVFRDCRLSVLFAPADARPISSPTSPPVQLPFRSCPLRVRL
ncbi:hypothetical protein MYA_3834 [Burkholderia sp. KJ006]|nr:hypothetical protein MYA_3834 [Burkholderia sp. KJ006]